MTKPHYFHPEQVAHLLHNGVTALIADSFAEGVAAQSWGGRPTSIIDYLRKRHSDGLWGQVKSKTFD